MTLQIVLNLVTMVMCIMTMALATAALAPQMKQALVIVRDGLLWTVLFAVIGAVAFVGWGRFFKAYAKQQQATAVPQPAAESPAPAQNPESAPKPKPAAEAKKSSWIPATLTQAKVDNPQPSTSAVVTRSPEPAFRANRSQ